MIVGVLFGIRTRSRHRARETLSSVQPLGRAYCHNAGNARRAMASRRVNACMWELASTLTKAQETRIFLSLRPRVPCRLLLSVQTNPFQVRPKRPFVSCGSPRYSFSTSQLASHAMPPCRLFTDDDQVKKPNISAERNLSRSASAKQERAVRAFATFFSRMDDKNRGLLNQVASQMAHSAQRT